MGIYLNPGNRGFSMMLNGEYIDKTGLIALINETIETPCMLNCISRPRRFGKSYAAKMLCAYYDSTCDSHELFDDKMIARSEDYRKHLNQYHVISLDITDFLSETKRRGGSVREIPNQIVEALRKELIAC